MATAIAEIRVDLHTPRANSNANNNNMDRAATYTRRATTTVSDRPLQPTFMEEVAPEEEEENTHVNDDVMAAYNEYQALPDEVRTTINLHQYMNQRRNKKKGKQERQPQRQHKEYKEALNKVPLPNFDGRTSDRAWVHKLDTFLKLKPMMEKDAIQFATMHLEGVAYD